MSMETTPTDLEFHFCPATTDDVPRIWQIILQAKEQMRRAGSSQWQDGYPLPENIEDDLRHHAAFVLRRGASVVAYGAVSFDSEPAYLELEGTWTSPTPYVVVHRLCVADEMKHQGVATRFFQEAERFARLRGAHSFRVDTNFDNRLMIQLLGTQGFRYCGKVYYGPRGERLAFEKALD
jgi:GNAT superfamily N-acetyltransferase